MTELELSLLNLLADIRAAVGDPKGKLMQDELVERCKMLCEFYKNNQGEHGGNK